MSKATVRIVVRLRDRTVNADPSKHRDAYDIIGRVPAGVDWDGNAKLPMRIRIELLGVTYPQFKRYVRQHRIPDGLDGDGRPKTKRVHRAEYQFRHDRAPPPLKRLMRDNDQGGTMDHLTAHLTIRCKNYTGTIPHDRIWRNVRDLFESKVTHLTLEDEGADL